MPMSQAEIESKQTPPLTNLWTPSYQLSTMWKQTGRVQAPYCNHCTIMTSGKHKLIFGTPEKIHSILELTVTWRKHCSTFSSDIYPYSAQAIVLYLEHHFPVILSNSKCHFNLHSMREKYVGAIRLTVQKATLPWDPFQAKAHECRGEKQKGKFIKEN